MSKVNKEWWPTKEEYDPMLTKEDWLAIIEDRGLCQEKWLHILARFFEYGGEGACSEIEDYYDEKRFSFNIQMQNMAKAIITDGRCSVMLDGGKKCYFPTIFLGRYAQKDDLGSYIWKLRDELTAALEEFDIVSWDHKYLLKALVEQYKFLISKTDNTEFLDEELYKWEYVTDNQNASPLKIIDYLIKNNLNIYDRVRDSQSWKTLLKDNPEGLETVILKLKDESLSLHDRLQYFKSEMKNLFTSYSFNSFANDERTAACFLSCWYPQTFTLYKDGDLYEPLCQYLGVKKAPAGSKYEHFLELANQITDIVREDSFLQNIFAEKTKDFVKSDLLIAQTIVWCVFSKRGQEALYGKSRKYWSIRVDADSVPDYIKNEKWLVKWGDEDDEDDFYTKRLENYINKVRTGDYIAFHSFDVKGNITIHYLVEVAGENEDTGEINVYKLPVKSYYSGKAPKLKAGKWSDVFVKVTGSNVISLIFNVGEEESQMIPEELIEYGSVINSKKNVILQGAPGTGKTYSTASLALYVIGQKEPDAIEGLNFNNHSEVIKRYEEYRAKHQIEFCTFHQSMDYEDFVEGLRPEVLNNGSSVTYSVKPGIFKCICNNALSSASDRIDNFEESWNRVVEYLSANGNFMVPLLSGKREIMIELNEYDNGLTERTYPAGDSFDKNSWLPGHSKFFSKDQLYNIYRGLPGVPAGGHDNYRKAIVAYMKQNFGLKEYSAGSNKNDDKNYVLIIDEINRGYVSKIFGELITLLEKDKRIGAEHPIYVKLPYSYEDFGVPSNLYIIGTMNTTDRTTGTLDYALRRRFDFITLEADPSVLDTSVSEARLVFDDVKAFIDDKKLDDMDISDLMVGHSYFMAKDTAELKNRIKYEVIPLVKEYIKDGILNCLPGEANEFFNDWIELRPHTAIQNPEE